MAKETALAKTSPVSSTTVSMEEQAKNFMELMQKVKSMILVRVSDDLKWNYELGRLVAGPLGISRDKSGNLVKDATRSYSKYGEQTIETIAKSQGVKYGFIKSRIDFFIKFHPDTVDKMAGSVIGTGSAMFPWKTVQVLMSLPSTDDRVKFVNTAIKRSLPPATIVSQAMKMRASFKGSEKKRSTKSSTSEAGAKKKGKQGRKVSPAIDACDAFVRFGKCLKEVNTRVSLMEDGMRLFDELPKRDTKLRPHAKREMLAVQELLGKLLTKLRKVSTAVNASIKSGSK